MVWYASLPDEGVAGTRDVTQIVLGHSIWTDNGTVLYDWYNLEIHLGVQTIDATGQLVTPNWIGSYFPQVIPVEPVSFIGNTVSAARTMRWQCDIGPCPAMPATIAVSVSARGIGAPRTTAAGGPDGTAVGQEWDAIVDVDSGGALTLPTMRYAWLFRGHSQILTR